MYKAVQSFMEIGARNMMVCGRLSSSICLETFLQLAQSIFIRGRLSVYKRLGLLVLKECVMKAFVNGQTLRTEFKLSLLWGLCLKFLVGG